ncbi:tRNA (cytosine(34)-C(5))-methyltransferase, mitochondrial [Cynoglossus semilaevis]|uniref:tRNA (cytosine(34)-C(5))-methyltransferase, mitochondrial n=1 Tax=Cynoglossus semilaevis TaxID=244447 RepID=UPI000495BF23|nr:tRNA (cytosine(34)-C(5))-methyltransferase, mitochondrial [Cynoglossus semilaevis]
MFRVHQLRKTRRINDVTGQTLKPKSTLWLNWSTACHSVPDQLCPGDKKQVTEKQKPQRSPCQPVLDLFNQQYSQELESLWPSIRSVLLKPQSWQHGVMLNRFTSVTGVTQTLLSQGFSRILPQSNAPALLHDSILTGNNPLLSNVFDCPPDDDNDTHPQCDSTPCSQSEDLQLERLHSLPQPSLQCYTHPHPLRFPSQPHRAGQIKQYYLLNASSLLPVLALQVCDGEKVLDLCSAPGGKAVAIMQCATPALLCCNEPDPHRRDWLVKTLESFLPHALRSRVIVSSRDGRCAGQNEAVTYDKVLVDAPCSNDRSWLYSCSSPQGEQRLKEKARLPALQAQLLKNRVAVERPGGLVVYSTCTLSRAENHDVVETVLRACPEAEPEDLWEEIAVPFSQQFAFAPSSYTNGDPSHNRPKPMKKHADHRLGILVVPQPGKTWGPMFLSRIRRRR